LQREKKNEERWVAPHFSEFRIPNFELSIRFSENPWFPAFGAGLLP